MIPYITDVNNPIDERKSQIDQCIEVVLSYMLVFIITILTGAYHQKLIDCYMSERQLYDSFLATKQDWQDFLGALTLGQTVEELYSLHDNFSEKLLAFWAAISDPTRIVQQFVEIVSKDIEVHVLSSWLHFRRLTFGTR